MGWRHGRFGHDFMAVDSKLTKHSGSTGTRTTNAWTAIESACPRPGAGQKAQETTGGAVAVAVTASDERGSLTRNTVPASDVVSILTEPA
jgi:hypothetical protein